MCLGGVLNICAATSLHYLVNYRHSETGTTALMVTAGQGFLTQMEQLLHMGADVNIKTSNGW